MQINDFQSLVKQKGQELYRDMPWRRDTRGYYILVSELMLQQTQVDRVIPKFEAFIAAFPDEQSLATANLADVLRLWQGLGYNRRAKYVQLAAQKIMSEHSGRMPQEKTALLRLPGVGQNTAGAISVYAFNLPVVFIETNVRTVYFHHFFQDNPAVSDNELWPLLEQTLDYESPRSFYWALMDYGSWLKRQGIKNVAQSTHYKKQSALSGSVRQVRGQIIKALTEAELSAQELAEWSAADERVAKAMAGLVKDELVEVSEAGVKLVGSK